MKKVKGFSFIIIALVALLVIFGSAMAESEPAGFHVTCEGATGFGNVPAGVTYEYYVRFYDPGINSGTGTVTDQVWQGVVTGPAEFSPAISWPITPAEGTTGADSYYWWEVFIRGVQDISKAEGHFSCEPPPPPSGQGCTPGFWQGKNNGRLLWNEPGDPDFTPTGGNPYTNNTMFNDYFSAVNSLEGLTMLDLVGSGGGSDPARKAARDLVAAYLNASHAGVNYPYSQAALVEAWNQAVTDGTFMDLHTSLDEANNLGCDININN